MSTKFQGGTRNLAAEGLMVDYRNKSLWVPVRSKQTWVSLAERV